MAKRQGLRCAFRWGVLFPERVQAMPYTVVAEAVIVLKEELQPPEYLTQLNVDASKIFFTNYLEYKGA